VLTLLIALAGLANAMVLDVLTRRREIGIVRAVGASRADVVKMVALEAVALAATAGILSVAVGTVLAHAMLGNIRADSGAAIVVLFPTGAVVGVILAGLLTGVLGGIAPSRRAVTFDPAEVMRSI
jgi:ABC-type antimicrobial peptide transport system permease subunit